MPRFIEINYLHQYQNERRHLLNTCLLGVPHHLDHLTSNSKKNHVDKIKHLQNISVDYDDDENLNGSKAEADFELLSSISCINESPFQLASFEYDVSTKNSNRLEVIPSSNPDSPIPDSFDDILLGDLEREVTTYVVNSLQHDADEDDMQLKMVADEESSDFLEEIETDWKLSDLCKMPTSPSKLSSKLRPARVSDPFLVEFVHEKRFLESDKKITFSDEDTIAEHSSEENFEIKKISFEDDLLLEEPMEPMPITDQKESLRIFPKEELKRLNVVEISAEDDDDMKGILVEKVLAGSVIEKLTKPYGETAKNALELELQLLISSNNEELKKDDLRLESPLQISALSRNELEAKDLFEAKMSPFKVSPLSQRHFISPSSKKRLETELQDGDKFLDNTLSMTLKVPESAGLQPNRCLPDLVNTCNRSGMDCDLEVSLPWDPLKRWTDDICKSKNILSSETKECFQSMNAICLTDDDDPQKIDANIFQDMSNDDFLTEYLLDGDKNSAQAIQSPGAKKAMPKEKNENFRELFMSRILERMQTCTQKENASETPSKDRCISKQPDVKPASMDKKIDVFSDSPLDTFMLLRTGEKAQKEAISNKLPVAMIPPRSIIKAAKVKPSVFKEDEKEDSTCQLGNNEEKQVQCQGKHIKIVNKEERTRRENKSKVDEIGPATTKRKSQIIAVELSNNYISILKRLERDSRPLLGFLKERKLVSHEYQFLNLKPDITRFLLCQQEKKHEDSAITSNDADIMKGIICLHALVLSSDAILHYGLPPAIGILKSIREKYEDFVGDLLESVRKQLAKEQFQLDTNFQSHPKIEKIIQMVQGLVSQPKIKIMILIRRYFECCYASLEARFRFVKNVVIKKYPREVAEESRAHEVISQANVIVAELSSELQFCPWNRFSYVFEFEHKKESEWVQLCHEGNPQMQGFYSFDCVELPCFYSTGNVAVSQVDTPTSADKPMKCFSEHIIIGSKKVTENKELLSELENRLNLTLIERDYSQLCDNLGKTPYCIQPDIIVDERTCVVLLSDDEIDGAAGSTKLLNIALSMMLKCLQCYILLMFLNAHEKGTFPYQTVDWMYKVLLQASQSRDKHDTKFHLIYAFSHEETATWISSVCNNARDSSPVWRADEWGKRFWLTEEISMHEKFLLSFPFFTSFTAQIALTATPLRHLLGFTLPEMKNALKWIPDRIIEAFHTALNKDVFGDIDECPTFTIDSYECIPAPELEDQSNEFGFSCKEDDFDAEFCDTSAEFKKIEVGSRRLPRYPECQIGVIQPKRSLKYSTNSQTFNDQRMPQDCESDEVLYRPATVTSEMNAAYRSYNPEKHTSDSSYLKRIPRNMADHSEIYRLRHFSPDAKLSGECYHKPERCTGSFEFHKEDDFVDIENYSHNGFSKRFDGNPAALRQNLESNDRKETSFPKWRVSASSTSNKTIPRTNRASSLCQFNRYGKDVYQKKFHSEDHHNYFDGKRQISGTPSTVRLAPSKKRRLAYERNPHARDGQTRLTFV